MKLRSEIIILQKKLYLLSLPLPAPWKHFIKQLVFSERKQHKMGGI